MYDGFISYSHAADDLLAPRLQAGLQRFAKPWWRRRAVRIFRDESSLSANPHLWSSITEALDSSGWFVLLLSPDAARSEWVNQEIAYWVEHRDPRRILPVVTDGTFGWVDGDVAGDVPDALRGVFTEEPRWVDVRWAKDEEQLDLQDPRFADVVADIASSIRGIAKDDLASEEVRQHRRTVRTAWAAGGLVAVLAVAAVVAGAFASRSAALARSRELGASAINVLDEDPQLAILLTLEAIAQTPIGEDQPVEVINALWTAVAADRLDAVIDHGFGGAAMLDVSADGSRLLVASELGNVVRLYGTADFELLWEWQLRTTSGEISEDTVNHVPRLSPDGARIVVPVIDPEAVFASEREGAQPDPRPSRLVVLDATSGAELRSVELGDCPGAAGAAWSPDGARLAIRNGGEPCPRDGAPSGWWVEVFDTNTWERLALHELPADPPNLGPVPAYDGEGDLFVFGNQATVTFDGQHNLLRTFDEAFGPGDVSPDGRLIVTNDPPRGRTMVTDTQTGSRVTLLPPFEFPQIPEGLKFSSTGKYIAFGNSTKHTLVWDTITAEIAFRLPSGTAEWVEVDDQTRRAYTGSVSDGSVRVWSLGPVDVGQTLVDELAGSEFVNANTFVFSERLGAFITTDFSTGTSHLRVFDLSSGELVDSPPYPELPNHQPDVLGPLYRLVSMSGDRFVYQDAGWWTIYDVEDGSKTRLIGCDAGETTDICRGTGAAVHALARSVDGGQLVARQGSTWVYFDADTGAVVSEEDLDTPTNAVVTFTDDWVMTFDRKSVDVVDRNNGSVVATVPGIDIGRFEVSDSGRLAVFNDTVGIVIFDLETPEARTIELGSGEIRAMSFASDETRVLVADEDAISIIDLMTDQVVQSIPFPGVSDVHWLGAEEVLVGTRAGEWVSISLNPNNLISDAKAGLFRSFTDQECLTYRIDPCPTLEELQDG
jgi:WD40 repeat protein